MSNIESRYFPQPPEAGIDLQILNHRTRLIRRSVKDGTIDFLAPEVRDMMMMYVEKLPRETVITIKPKQRKELDTRGISLLLAMHEADLSKPTRNQSPIMKDLPRKLVAHRV